MRGVVIALALLTSTAHADSRQLANAREAIDAVNYDEARTQLDAALAGGGLTAAETAEAYRLLGNTLAVIKPDEAEAAYRRYLALDPRAELATTAPAKQRRPFTAAQSFIAAQGALTVAALRSEGSIVITVKSDPLAMAADATLDAKGRVDLAIGKPASMPWSETAPARVAIRDVHGNTLLEVDVPIGTTPIPGGIRVEDSRRESPAPPLYRHWIVWAVPAVALGATGAYFAVQAGNAQDDLNAIAGTHGEFFARDFDDAESRRDRSRLLAGTFLGLGAACAVTAVVMLVTKPSAQRVIAPTASADGAGVVFHAPF